MDTWEDAALWSECQRPGSYTGVTLVTPELVSHYCEGPPLAKLNLSDFRFLNDY